MGGERPVLRGEGPMKRWQEVAFWVAVVVVLAAAYWMGAMQ